MEGLVAACQLIAGFVLSARAEASEMLSHGDENYNPTFDMLLNALNHTSISSLNVCNVDKGGGAVPGQVQRAGSCQYCIGICEGGPLGQSAVCSAGKGVDRAWGPTWAWVSWHSRKTLSWGNQQHSWNGWASAN